MNYIVAQSNIPDWNPYHSTGVWINHQDWPLESADDYLSSDDRVSSEGKQDFGQSWVDGHWIGQTLTETHPKSDFLLSSAVH